MEVYLRDKFVKADAALVSVEDRSFRFGDGVFETVIIANGKMFDWELHKRRLQNGLEYFKLDIDIEKILPVVEELISRNSVVNGYARIVVSRGVNPPEAVGYMVRGAKAYMVVQALPKALPEFKTIRLLVSEHRAFYHYPSKTNNALLYTMALLEAEAAGYDNALLLSHDGFICETTNANIFWIKGDVLYTPSSDLPFISGTVQQRVLELWEGEMREGRFTLDDLQGADEIFMTNVGGIVTAIGEVAGVAITLKSSEKTLIIRNRMISLLKNIRN